MFLLFKVSSLFYRLSLLVRFVFKIPSQEHVHVTSSIATYDEMFSSLRVRYCLNRRILVFVVVVLFMSIAISNNRLAFIVYIYTCTTFLCCYETDKVSSIVFFFFVSYLFSC